MQARDRSRSIVCFWEKCRHHWSCPAGCVAAWSASFPRRGRLRSQTQPRPLRKTTGACFHPRPNRQPLNLTVRPLPIPCRFNLCCCVRGILYNSGQPLILVSKGSIEHAFQNRRLPNRRLVLRRLLHGRRLGDCRMARRAGLLRDLSTSGNAAA